MKNYAKNWNFDTFGVNSIGKNQNFLKCENWALATCLDPYQFSTGEDYFAVKMLTSDTDFSIGFGPKNVNNIYGKNMFLIYVSKNEIYAQNTDQSTNFSVKALKKDDFVEISRNYEIGQISWMVNGSVYFQIFDENLKNKNLELFPKLHIYKPCEFELLAPKINDEETLDQTCCSSLLATPTSIRKFKNLQIKISHRGKSSQFQKHFFIKN